jgi:hypothetical protein
MTYFEEQLHQKTKDTNSDILYSYWGSEKGTISEKLKYMINLFPHYSLHDETHSYTILNNIQKLIGKEGIDSLSSIDIWLILLSSFYHDIGMFATADELQEAILEGDFLEFFDDLAHSQKEKLHPYTKNYTIKDDKLVRKDGTKVSLESEDIKYILAEYFRKQHSQRSKEKILEHSKKYTTKIPDRVFEMLGKICDSHMQDFSYVLSLPYSQMGIDTDSMHPRFVACLLRLGDLLDLDNNRFSDILLSTIHTIPQDTLLHISKHKSIKEFDISDELSIVSVCEKYEEAKIMQDWFDYIEYEIRDQKLNWNTIIPSTKIKELPTIKELKVVLKGYKYIEKNERPKFSIDHATVLQMLRGDNIYKSKYQALREILQNSVDSTLQRVWLENKETIDGFEGIDYKSFYELSKSYPIQISIDIDEEKNIFTLHIKDNGIGISMEDLKYLSTASSSEQNKRKQRVIRKMPKWISPSGNFGIGFQSIFMLTDKIEIKTKSYYTPSTLDITLHDPSGKKDGAIYIKEIANSHHTKPYLQMSLTQELGDWHIDSDYDYFTNDNIEKIYYNIEQIVNEIKKFATHSLVPIEVDGYFSKDEFDSTKQVFAHSTRVVMEDEDDFDVAFDIETDGYYYYKNQKVSRLYSRNEFINYSINLFAHRAKDTLTINRNSFKDEYRIKYIRKIENSVKDKICRLLDNDFEKVVDTQYQKNTKQNREHIRESFALFYDYHKGGTKYREYYNETKVIDSDTTIAEILDANEVVYVDTQYYRDRDGLFDIYNICIDKKDDRLYIYHYRNNSIVDFIITKLKENFKITKDIDYYTKVYSKKESFDIKNLNYNLLLNIHSKRKFLPCKDEYSHLRLKDDSTFTDSYSSDIIENYNTPKMLSPFNYQDTNINDKLLEWVYNNRYNENTTIDEIKDSYERFIDQYKEATMIDESQKEAILVWTNSTNEYRKIKEAQEGNLEDEHYEEISDRLLELFDILPSGASGSIYRGDILEGSGSDDELCNEFLQEHKKGMSKVLAGSMLSWSLDRDIALSVNTTNSKSTGKDTAMVLYTLKNPKSKYINISKYSLFPNENEVVSKPNIKYKIVDIKREKNIIFVELDED